MRLFPRTLLIVALTLIILILFVNTVVIGVVGEQLNRLEENNISRSMDRIDSLLIKKMNVQLAELRDNAHWDVTYHYLQDPTGGFVATYFVSGTFHYMNLNFVLLYDLNGTLVDMGGYDFETGKLTAVSLELTDYLHGHSFLLHHDGLDDDHQIISRIGDDVVMISTSPVLTTEETGPIMGSLVMGRVIDEREIGDLADEGDVSLEACAAFDQELPSDYIAA